MVLLRQHAGSRNGARLTPFIGSLRLRKLPERHDLKRPRQFHASGSSAADPRTLRVSRRAALVGSGWKAGRQRRACVWKWMGSGIIEIMCLEVDGKRREPGDNVVGSGWEAERGHNVNGN